ncbi:MAG: ATP-binding protein [Longimicrobiales bacterium]
MYLPRVVDRELRDLLSSIGGVVIEGPKACGKTETARQVAASEVRLDVDLNARQAVSIDPSLVLEGALPRLLDEWQLAPSLWNHVRRAVDDRRAAGQFILTGSAVPADDVTRHTGAGRLARLRMRPMSLYESGHSTGQVSLSALLGGTSPRVPDTGMTVPDLAERIAVGGWPGLLDQPVPQALRAVRAYVDEIRRTDVQRVEGVAHDPEKVLLLMRSLARNVSTMTSLATLARDVGELDETLAKRTVSAYYEALTRLMVVEDQPAWAPHLRSRSRVRTSPRRHFVDPSVAVAILRATPERLLQDLNLLGFLFESLVVRDLRVYAQACDAQVLHYRDNADLEVDAVVEAADGRWAAFEIKLGSGAVDEGADHLTRFARRIDTEKCGAPRALGVITGTGLAYTRPDGIAVVPIGTLGP